MKFLSTPRVLSLWGTALALSSLNPLPAQASAFTETAIDPSQVIAVARPYGTETTKYDLLMIEQIPNKNKCWETVVGEAITVEPLLLNFDFTGHCRRATDSNGYSVRIDGQDYGLEYLLRVVPRGNELVLVATSRTGQMPEIILGSTRGMAPGFMQIQLNPGWQFTKRTFNGKALGHYYISGTQAALAQPTQPTTRPADPQMPAVVPPAPTPGNDTSPREIIIPSQPLPTNSSRPPETAPREVIIQANPAPPVLTPPAVTGNQVNTSQGTRRPVAPAPSRRPIPSPQDFRSFQRSN